MGVIVVMVSSSETDAKYFLTPSGIVSVSGIIRAMVISLLTAITAS